MDADEPVSDNWVVSHTPEPKRTPARSTLGAAVEVRHGGEWLVGYLERECEDYTWVWVIGPKKMRCTAYANSRVRPYGKDA